MEMHSKGHFDKRVWVLPLFIASISAILYITSLVPGTSYFKDASEFQTKLYDLEIIHATGYPYYQLLGKVWVSILPFGSIAWRVNLFSAFFSVITLLCLCRIMQRLDSPSWAIISACGTLACSSLIWTHSIVASTYSMHIALVALTALALLSWQEGHQRGALWFALACGMGLSHHRTFIISLPAFVFCIWVDKRTRDKALHHWQKLAVIALIPMLISYVWLASLGLWPLKPLFHYLFIEGGKYTYHVASLTEFINRFINQIIPWILEPFKFIFTSLAISGLLILIGESKESSRRKMGILLLSMALSTVLFFSVIWITPDDRRYFQPLDFALAAGWGFFWEYFWKIFSVKVKQMLVFSKVLHVALAIIAITPLLWLYPINLESFSKLRDGYADEVSREILSTVESDAIIAGRWVMIWPIKYYRDVEGMRTDTEIQIGEEHRDDTFAAIEAGLPVYFRQPMYELDSETSPYIWIPILKDKLWRVIPRHFPLVHTEEISYQFNEGAQLKAFGLSAWPLKPDSFIRFWTEWQVSPDPKTKIALQLKDELGKTIWEHRTTWEQFEESGGQEGNSYFLLSPTAPPGDYLFSMELEEADTDQEGDKVQLCTLSVAPNTTLNEERLVLKNDFTPPVNISPTLNLLGYDFSEDAIAAGQSIKVRLFWQKLVAEPSSHQTYLVVEKAREQIHVDCDIVIERDQTLAETECTIPIPREATAGKYQVVLYIKHGESQQKVPLQELEIHARSHSYKMPSPEYPINAMLNQEIRLLGYDLSPETVSGEKRLTLTLYWQPLSPVTGSYKVFAHLITSDGKLIGQHDSEPMGDTAPTRYWVPKEIIADRHSIPLPSDLPDGEYQLYTGMYIQETGERLTASDEGGQPYPNNAISLQAIAVNINR